ASHHVPKRLPVVAEEAVEAHLQVFWRESGILRYPGKRDVADFFAVVKGEREVGPTRALKPPVRTDLFLQGPTNPQKGGVDALRLRCPPAAHAAKSILRESGTSSPFSIMSARICSATAFVLRTASSGVSPYAITPGSAGTEARMRPSSSRSTSMRNG